MYLKSTTEFFINAHSKQLFLYGMLGIINNILAYLFFLFLSSKGFDPKIAMTVVYCISVIISFLANKRYVFGLTDKFMTCFISFLLVYLIGYALNLSLLMIFVDNCGLPYQYVQAGSIFIVAVFIFIALKFFVFPQRAMELK